MNGLDLNATNLYLTDEYIEKNPAIHEEDSPWKVRLIIPFIDKFIGCLENPAGINLLDVGGGAGIILSETSEYIKLRHHIDVNKLALDLSPGMLEMQKKRNPDLQRSLNADIRQTPFGNKEVDLTLMIDVLEHVPAPTQALTELRRFSRFILFKVPLENNLQYRVSNFLKKGQLRQRDIEVIGHINVYKWSTLLQQLKEYAGEILDHRFTNVCDYYLHSAQYREQMKHHTVIFNRMAAGLFKLSPELCSLIFSDFVMVLVRCY